MHFKTHEKRMRNAWCCRVVPGGWGVNPGMPCGLLGPDPGMLLLAVRRRVATCV
ncbi:hypothetical protein [Ktedonospora formicarum]|uniref:hypothetical protein n=1 Tax=Ktedonospora formicarum TaxID=2778364 RepID=UPI001C68F07C|nr:hypothetical protein [Ktedonospora formicarum]